MNLGFESVGDFLIWITLMSIGGILYEIYQVLRQKDNKNKREKKQ